MAVRLHHLPPETYPGMPYATAPDLARATPYSAAHIQRLIQAHEISGLRLAGRWVADTTGVEQLLQRAVSGSLRHVGTARPGPRRGPR